MFVRALPNSTAHALLEKNETLLLKDDVLMEIDGEAVGSLPCCVFPLPICTRAGSRAIEA